MAPGADPTQDLLLPMPSVSSIILVPYSHDDFVTWEAETKPAPISAAIIIIF